MPRRVEMNNPHYQMDCLNIYHWDEPRPKCDGRKKSEGSRRQPMNEKLREDIEKILQALVNWNMEIKVPKDEQLSWRQAEDKIITLFQPLIEEVKKEERQRIFQIVEAYKVTPIMFSNDSQIRTGDIFINGNIWQALKE